MKANNVIWFTQMANEKPIGIVFGIDENTSEKKAYIGCGDGFNEDFDIENILSTGAKLTKETANSIVKQLSA